MRSALVCRALLVLGEEPGVRGGEERGGRRVLRNRNLRFRETKATRRGSSSLFQEKINRILEKNCLKDRNNDKVGNAAQLCGNNSVMEL